MSPNLVDIPLGAWPTSLRLVNSFQLKGACQCLFFFKIPPNSVFATAAGFNGTPKIARGFGPCGVLSNLPKNSDSQKAQGSAQSPVKVM